MSFLGGKQTFLGTYMRFLKLFLHSIHEEFVSNDFSLFTFKRLVVLSLFWVIYSILLIFNHMGFALDDIFYTEWRHVKIEKPLFIVGNARSGTTWMHRILSSSDEHFTFFRTWEILFGCSITWRFVILYLYRIDQSVGGPLTFTIESLERWLVGGIKVHAIGLNLAEEDEWLMMWICKAQLLMMPFPLAGPLLGPLVLFDNTLSISTKMDIMTYYKECVQRHIYVRDFGRIPSNRRIFLSKNPPFTLRLDTLKSVFPDCRIACMLRDPIESVPSMVSYISKTWHAFASPTIEHPRFHDLIGFCMAHYSHPISRIRGDCNHLDNSLLTDDDVQDHINDIDIYKNKENRELGQEPETELDHEIGKGDCGSTVLPVQATVITGGETNTNSTQRSVANYDNISRNGKIESIGCFVEYKKLRTELVTTVLDTLKRLKYFNSQRQNTMTFVNDKQLISILQKEQTKAQTYVTTHKYDVETTCKVSDTDFRNLFSNVYQIYDFDGVK